MDRALRQGEYAVDAEGGSSSSTELRPLSAGAYNGLIRRLGKADRLADVFEVLDRMTALGVESNHETLEFVTNAAVKEVEFETRAVSMKSLPSGERIVFGQGKSRARGHGERMKGKLIVLYVSRGLPLSLRETPLHELLG